MDWRFSLVGLLVGFLVGLTGVGGGSLLAPILLLLFRVPPVWTVGTDIAYSTVTKAVGSLVHIRQGFVKLKIALLLACGSVPATLSGALLVNMLRQRSGALVNTVIVHALGVVLLAVATLLVLRPSLARLVKPKQHEVLKQQANLRCTNTGEVTFSTSWVQGWKPFLTVLIGAVVGFLVGLTSVGSGSLITVALLLLFPQLSLKELVGTDIFQAFLMLLAGSVGYFLNGAINWTITGLLLVGALPGVLLGSRLSKYIPNAYMRPLLALLLAASGWKLI